MNFSDFRVFRTFDTLPFKRLLLHIFQKTNNIEVVFVPEDVDGAREMVETIIFRVCISQGYPTKLFPNESLKSALFLSFYFSVSLPFSFSFPLSIDWMPSGRSSCVWKA